MAKLIDIIRVEIISKAICIIDRESDLNRKDYNDETALTLASRKKVLEIIKKLLEKGAHVNAKDEDNLTALMLNVLNVGALASRSAKGNCYDNAVA